MIPAPGGGMTPATVELTQEQRAIVEAGDGPVVVIAGAGTGKTRVIVERVRWLLETGDAGDGQRAAGGGARVTREPRTPLVTRSAGSTGSPTRPGSMLLEYDESVDVAYLMLSDMLWDHQVRLDDARGINYAADGSVIGIEILSPQRHGVRL